jgi:CDP-4-dehydro-6-deoxyglucose reductase, E1
MSSSRNPVSNHKWPLNVSNFTWLDRLKLAKFFLTPSTRWTMGNYVTEFERRMCEFVGSKYAIFVSSGSTANTLIAMYLRDLFPAHRSVRNVVVCPSTTWTTSISPFIREGFEPKFIDINFGDLSMDLNQLESYLRKSHEKVACIFVTSLIGLTPDMDRLHYLARKYNVIVMMDNCENTFGKVNGNNISSLFTSTTSTYFGHQIQSVEGGFVFTDSHRVYEHVLMLRNHGMVRSLDGLSFGKSFYSNKDVDPLFDFNLLGNNFRNSNIHAFIGLLDLDRADEYIEKRKQIYSCFAKST